MKKILTIAFVAVAALFFAAPDASAYSETLQNLAENMSKENSDGISAHYNGTYFEIKINVTDPEEQNIWIDTDEKELRQLISEEDEWRAIMNMLYDEGSAFMLVINCGNRGERSFYFTIAEEKAILGL